MQSSLVTVPPSRLLVLVLLGLGFGVATSTVNHGLGPAAAYVSVVLGSGSAWLFAGFCAALAGRGWRGAFGHGVAFLVPAVAGYYVADAAAGVYASPTMDNPTGPLSFDRDSMVMELGFYLIAAFAASAVLGLVVTLIQRGGPVGMLASVVVPGYIAFTALALHQRLLAVEFAHDPAEIAATWWIGILALIMTIGLIPVRLIAGRRAAPPDTSPIRHR